MKEISSERIKRNLNKGNIKLFIGLILLLLAISTPVIGYFVNNAYIDSLPDPDNVSVEGDGAKVKILGISDSFASYSDDDSDPKFHFTVDENGLGYIVFMVDNQFEKIANTEDLADNAYIVTGKAYNIADDLKDVAIDVLKDTDTSEEYTEEYFRDDYGYIYLDATEKVSNPFIYICFVGVVLLICGLYLIINYVSFRKKIVKTIKNYGTDKINGANREVESALLSFDKDKFYVTNNYLVDVNKTLDIVSYNDIVWVYRSEVNVNGSKTNKCLNIYTRDRDKHVISLVNVTKEEFDKLFDIVCNKVSKDTLIGYEEDTKKTAKSLYNVG